VVYEELIACKIFTCWYHD